jgi:hypothetical protein
VGLLSADLVAPDLRPADFVGADFARSLEAAGERDPAVVRFAGELERPLARLAVWLLARFCLPVLLFRWRLLVSAIAQLQARG